MIKIYTTLHSLMSKDINLRIVRAEGATWGEE